MKELSIFNQLRPVTVGFDSVFDNFERMFSDDFFSTPSSLSLLGLIAQKKAVVSIGFVDRVTGNSS
mgnify:CR=1 FL=1